MFVCLLKYACIRRENDPVIVINAALRDNDKCTNGRVIDSY